MSINYRKEIEGLTPYKPGKPIEDVKREYGLDKVIKLASNENPLGCSERVKEKLSNSLDILALYPDGNATELKETLSEKLNISVDNILIPSGSDEMIDLISKTYISPGDEVIMADITFPRYIATTKMMGGIPIVVPLKNFTFDLEGILDKITDKTKMIWICNPNNPTGTMVTKKELINFFDKVPSNVIIAYDEAYREFVTRDDYPMNSIEFVEKYPNVLIMRTFSKAYGLAGIRVAYAVGEKNVVENINKVRGPFNVNSLAQIAAVAALEDQDFIKEIYNVNLEGKNYLYNEFEKLGFEFPESETNHIYVNVERDASEIFVELQKRGVIIRPMGGTWIRVSIGTMEENKIFIEKLKEVLG